MENNEGLNTIAKIIQEINDLEAPVYTDNYFVKKQKLHWKVY